MELHSSQRLSAPSWPCWRRAWWAQACAQARREPPPAVIPTAETQQAEQLFKSGRYPEAVAEAKAALTKNERYTPAMLVMAKSFYKLHKFEWMKKLWEMMQANGASNPEKAEIYQLLAFLEVDQKNVPGAIVLFKQADRSQARRRGPLEQSRGPVPDRQELWRGDPGPGEGRQPSTGIRQGPPELGRRLPGKQGLRKSSGGVSARPTALPKLCRRGVQPRHPLPRRRQDSEHGSFRQREHRDSVPPKIQADDGRDAGCVRPGRRLHRRRPRTRSRKRKSGSIGSRSSRSATLRARPRKRRTTPRKPPRASRRRRPGPPGRRAQHPAPLQRPESPRPPARLRHRPPRPPPRP